MKNKISFSEFLSNFISRPLNCYVLGIAFGFTFMGLLGLIVSLILGV